MTKMTLRLRPIVVVFSGVMFCIALFHAVTVMSFAQSGFGMPKGLKNHHQAPDFQLSTVDGQQLNKASLQGKPTLMMFWAPWCHVCQMELPKIHDFYEAVKPYGFQVVAVGFADAKENVVGYMDGHSDVFTFPSAYDVDNIVAGDFKIRATPTFVLLDVDGSVRLVHPGAGVLHNPKLLSFIEELVS